MALTRALISFTVTVLAVSYVGAVKKPGDDLNVRYLVPNETVEIVCVGNVDQFRCQRDRGFDVFCFKGFPSTSPEHIFTSVKLRLETKDPEAKAFQGNNVTAIYEDYEASLSWFAPPKIFDWGPPYGLKLYQPKCVGISSKPPYSVTLMHLRLDFVKVLLFLGGLLIFMKARALCVNTGVYYGSGMMIGIVCSMIVLVFLLGRKINRKSVAMAVMVGGWSIALYVLNVAKDNFLSMVTAYSVYFGGYCALCALLSFFLMYRYQPMRHPRSIDIMEWVMQAVGGLMMFGSSEVKEFSMLSVLLALAWRYFPQKWSIGVREYLNFYRYRYKWFQPQHRYLTEQEFIEQGYHETRTELKKLREYCASPNCNAWRTVNRLRDPKRFAEFVDGGQHITDTEILTYDTYDPRLPDSDSEEEPARNVENDSTYSFSAGPSTSGVQKRRSVANKATPSTATNGRPTGRIRLAMPSTSGSSTVNSVAASSVSNVARSRAGLSLRTPSRTASSTSTASTSGASYPTEDDDETDSRSGRVVSDESSEDISQSTDRYAEKTGRR